MRSPWNRPVFPKRSLVLKNLTIHSLCQTVGQGTLGQCRNSAKKRASEKQRFLSPLLTQFSALFLFRSVFPTNLEPRTGCTTQINALIHVTLALCHLTQVDSAKKESSENESVCPFTRSKDEVLVH